MSQNIQAPNASAEGSQHTTSQTSVQSPSTIRGGISRGASHSLKDLHGNDEDPGFEEATNAEGKTVWIKNSGIVHTLSHVGCLPPKNLKLFATLFYDALHTPMNQDPNFPDVAREDINFGAHISDMAVYEFVQTIDYIMVPWKKGTGTKHRCLDSLPAPRIMEIALSRPENLQISELRRHVSLLTFEKKWSIQVVFQENDVFRRYKRLVVFDMDSTLIQQEVIDEIAKYVGVEDKVSAITARAMNGELDFTESLRQRVALLGGVPATVFESLKSVITFTPGARELTRALKTLGYKMAVLSGGFVPLANYVKEELGLDYAFANTLAVSADGKYLTGEVTGDIVHAERKAELLQQIAEENKIPLQQVIAIGDGANDLKMMHKAGLGIAFNAKPLVQHQAPCRLNSETLQDVLYILGFTKGEQEQILEL